MRSFLLALLLPATTLGFVVPRYTYGPATTTTTTTATSTTTTTITPTMSTTLWSSSSSSSTPNPDNSINDNERMKQILQEEALSPENMKKAAEMMTTITPDEIDSALQEMDNMSSLEKEEMKSLGMNPEIMKQSMEMMKNDPDMVKGISQMLSKMSPEELLEQSKRAQDTIAAATAASASGTGTSVSSTTSATTTSVVEDDDDDDDDDENTEPIPPPSVEILDTMYRVGELMSDPPTGKVTLAGFAAIPPIALLVGDDTERDLSIPELKECWADGSLGSTRVDRTGFERVWMEVQDYFSLPMMDKARERTLKNRKNNKKQRGGNKPKPISSPVTATAPATTPATTPASSTNLVGDSISPEVLQEQMKNIDMDDMLSQKKKNTSFLLAGIEFLRYYLLGLAFSIFFSHTYRTRRPNKQLFRFSCNTCMICCRLSYDSLLVAATI